MAVASSSTIKPIDAVSVHKITSGQVVVDLQTAVKELLENSLDAGATNVEIRFRDMGLKTIEVIDNGSGIAAEDYDSIGLKHHTSKLSSYEDLTSVFTFGFRGEAISSLCAMSESVTVTTATVSEAPMGTVIELDRNGRVVSKDSKVARQRGTTVTISGLFKPLAVRRKEFERNAKREYAKALNLLNAYALVPCAKENRGVRLAVSNQDGGRKNVQIRTDGSPSIKASVSALWGPKSLDSLVDLNLDFEVEMEKSVLRRQGIKDASELRKNPIKVVGLISKFSLGCGRTGTDRQFFFINSRPCNPSKVQKAFNEIYRSFNINQSPFIVADFILPPDSCDINVSPDKRTILLHSEENLVQALKLALEETFSSSRSTYNINEPSQNPRAKQSSQSNSSSQPQSQLPSLGYSGLDPDRDDGFRTKIREPPDRSEDEGIVPRTSSNDLTLDILLESGSSQAPLFVPSRSSSPIADKEDKAQSPISHTRIASSQTLATSSPSLSSESVHNRHPIDASPTSTAIEVSPREQSVGNRPATTIIENAKNMTVESSSSAEVTSHPVIKRKDHPQQMVLDTSNASWNLLRDSSDIEKRPPKKARTSVDQINLEKTLNRKERTRRKKIALWEFALSGSQADVNRETTADKSDNDDDDECSEMDVDLRGDSGDSRPDFQVEKDDKGHSDVEEIDELADDCSEPDEMLLERPRGLLELVVVDQHITDDDSVAMKSSSDVHHDRLRTDRTSSMISTDEVVLVPPPHGPDDFGSDSDHPWDPSSEANPGQTSSQEIVRTRGGEQKSLRVDLSKLTNTWSRLRQRSSEAVEQTADAVKPLQSVTYIDDDAGFLNSDEETAAVALSRVIDKNDFNQMEVVGQFNLGFIIARRRRPELDEIGNVDNNNVLDDLFIVDQHAADEKYNFEDLQQTTKFPAQKLVHPQPLQLSAAEEVLAVENIDILLRNGFDIAVNDNEDRDPGVPRLSLVGRPISKDTVFDMKDLEELLHLMQDLPTGEMVRCSKTRAMLAMRACRKSIMVGRPLNYKQMTLVLRHMSAMNQPWNCPHGRPTMRHLCDLSCVSARRLPPIDWKNFSPTETTSE